MAALHLPDTIVLERRPEPNGLMEAVVDHWEHALRQRLTQTNPRPLGLATGRTMEPFYAALRERLRLWSPTERARLRQGWLSFNLDEYVGRSAADPDSFAAYMQHQLAGPLKLSPDQLRVPNGAAADPEQEAMAYGQALQAAGGVGLQLLGLGANGHVGFNEPPCGADVICRCVSLRRATQEQNAAAFGGDPQQVPDRAITLGLAEILAAEEVHLIVTGNAKREILARVFATGCDPSLPASWLLRHPRVRLWADDAALGVAVAAR